MRPVYTANLDWLKTFVTESNRIEGIHRDPLEKELEAHAEFLNGCCTVPEVKALVAVLAPGHAIRDKVGLDVRVGGYIAPAGGPDIEPGMKTILSSVVRSGNPWHLHRKYESLHPFTDGNGRSGRAIWLFGMVHSPEPRNRRMAQQLGFLHTFYYQTLQNADDRA